MPNLLVNKKARFDYEILETFEAGIELKGHEVKTLRNKRGSLAGARVILRGGEAFVIGLDIPAYQPANISDEYDSQRVRKLLLNQKEISYLIGKAEEAGRTIIVLRIYTKGKYIKAEIAVARGRKKHDKREQIKEREAKRKIERELKQQNR